MQAPTAKKWGGGTGRDTARTLRNRKGFTLVELIIVLVILAILASVLVPALTGYIDKAKRSDLLTRAKYAMTAAQAGLSEMYGEGITVNIAEGQNELTNAIYVLGETDPNAYIIVVTKKGTFNSKNASTDYSPTSNNQQCYKIYGFYYSESADYNKNAKTADNETIFYVYDDTTGTRSWDATKAEFDECYNKGKCYTFHDPY